MATYGYADVQSRITPLMRKVQETGLPSRVDSAWLASIGFNKSNDPSLTRVLKQIGFVEGTGVPSPRWQRYRDKQAAPIVLAEAIRDGYSDLFKIYPSAEQQAEADLEDFFASNTTAGELARRRMVRTFQALCSLADFSEADDTSQEEQPAEGTSPQRGPTAAVPPTKAQPTVHVDLQIHISPDAGPEQIDQIFASMAKHLYDK